MTQTLTSDMVRSSLDVFLARVEEPHEFSAEEVRELLSSCEIPVLVLERLWLQIQGILDRGMECRKFCTFLNGAINVLELGVKAFTAAQAPVRNADLSSQEKEEGLSKLQQAGRRAVEMRDKLAKLVRWISTPPRPIDPATLPSGRGDPNAPGYISLDDLMEQWLAGEK